MIDYLGNPEALFPKGDTRSEHTQLGMALNEPGAGSHREQIDLTAALAALGNISI